MPPPDASSRQLRWYEHITEAAWFKRIVDPNRPGGRFIVTLIALAFGLAAFVQNPNTTRDCQSNPKRGIYNPQRLQIIKTCQTVTGTVVHVSSERDGDIHIRAQVPAKWLTSANTTSQHGDLVIEYLPSDSWPRPRVGDRIKWTGTWVKDLQHGGWAEIHPVFGAQPLAAAARRTIP